MMCQVPGVMCHLGHVCVCQCVISVQCTVSVPKFS